MARRGKGKVSLNRRFILFGIVIFLCILPGVLRWLGIRLSWQYQESTEGALLEGLTDPTMQSLHGLMQGSTIYTLLEWTVVCFALATTVLAFAQFRIKQDLAAPIISMAAFWAAVVIAFHVLAFHGLGVEVVHLNRFVHINWTVSQTFTGVVFLTGALSVLWRGLEPSRVETRHLVVMALFFSMMAYAIILWTAGADRLPEMIDPEAWIKKPAGLIPLALFLVAAVVVFPLLERMCRSTFTLALWLAMVPLVASQVYMVFYTQELFDAGFLAAQITRTGAYTIIFAGLVWDYSEVCREEVKLYERLLARDRRVDGLIQNATEIVISFDEERRIHIWNPRAEAIFDLRRDEAQGRDVITMLFPLAGNGDSARAEFLHMLKNFRCSGTAQRLAEEQKVVIKRRDGREISLEYSLVAIPEEEDQTWFILLARDITERDELYVRTIQMDRLAAMGTLAAGVVHEINNPLTYISSSVEFARQDVERLESKLANCRDLALKSGLEVGLKPSVDEVSARIAAARKWLASAEEGARRIHKIVGDMRVFSHGNALDGEAVSVEKVLELAVRLTRGEVAKQARIELEIETKAEVCADETKLSQVFVNLMVNAAQAMGRVDRPDHLLRIRAYEEDLKVVICFADTGHGMNKEVRRRIFSPFFTTKSVGEGTGLGLSISRSIIEECGGRIEVESEPGRGSIFRVELPVAGGE